MMPYVSISTSGLRGLQGPVVEQAIQTGAGTGVAVASAAALPGALTLTTLAVPIAGAVAAVGLIIYGWMARRNAQKVAATHVVDEAEPLLAENRDVFLSLPNPSTSDQAAALQYFDVVWGQVVKECRAIGGGGGERCITDRQPGGMWDWFAFYRTPIESAPVSSAGVFSSPLEIARGNPLLAAGAVALLTWAALSGSRRPD